MAALGCIGDLYMLASGAALPIAEAGGDHAQRIEHVDLRHAAQIRLRLAASGIGHHVECCHAGLLGSVGLNRAHNGFAADFVKRFGTIARSEHARHIGLQMLIGEHAQQASDAASL